MEDDRMMCSAANVDWENYCMFSDYMYITNLFWNNFIKWQIFLKIFAGCVKIMDAWILDN